MNIYQCPICSQELVLTHKTWKCVNNHCFDVAKEGHVNLLPVNKKRSKEPGDSKFMLQSRRRFLNHGYYKPLADLILRSITSRSNTNSSVLDLGCGEGYYLEHMISSLNTECKHRFAALDISKFAVQMTAKRMKPFTASVECCVASAVDTPYAEEYFDTIYNVFAPYSDREINRILKPEGRFILVGPGEKHLNELSRVIYGNVQPHEGNAKSIANSQVLQLVNSESICTTVQIPHEFIPDLLAMTPYYWSTHETQKQKLFAMQGLEVTLHFDIKEYSRTQENNV